MPTPEQVEAAPMMKYSKILVLKLNPALKLKDIEDALFWGVFNTSEYFGRKRTKSRLRFVFRRDTRELSVKLNEEGRHFWHEAGDFLHLVERNEGI